VKEFSQWFTPACCSKRLPNISWGDRRTWFVASSCVHGVEGIDRLSRSSEALIELPLFSTCCFHLWFDEVSAFGLSSEVSGWSTDFDRELDATALAGYKNQSAGIHRSVLQSSGLATTNQQGYAEAYKDVVHEDQIQSGGRPKARTTAFVWWNAEVLSEAKNPRSR